MSGQSAAMSASESRSVQKMVENGKPLCMPNKEVSTSSMNNETKGGAKKKAITHKS
jgi:hypothetical protein